MSEYSSPDTPLDQLDSAVEEAEVRTITLYEGVGDFLLRTAQTIKELSRYELPAKLLDRLREEWKDLDLLHRRTGPRG